MRPLMGLSLPTGARGIALGGHNGHLFKAV